MSDQPNVIVLVADTFRPDHLGINGHPYCRTPELDAFVRRGATFDQAMVSSFPTIPMRTDWFTGRFGHPRHGWKPLDPQAFTLPKALALGGYTTQLLASTTHLLRNDFWKPFHHFDFSRGLEGDAPFARGNEPVRKLHANRRKTRMEFGRTDDKPALCDIAAHVGHRVRYEDEHHSSELATRACRFIEDNWKAGPFFLWVDSFDPHEPWFPPEHLWRAYDPDYSGEPMCHPNYSKASHYEAHELKNMQARYAATCTLVSKQFGRILRTVEDAGLFENTIVVFMSDHGMSLGERGVTGKTIIQPDELDHLAFHPEIGRLCWTMHVPERLGCKAAHPGARFAQPIQAPDLLPTVLDLCGLKPPSSVDLEGCSLVPLLKGQTDAPPRAISVTAGTGRISSADGTTFCRRPTVTDGRWTLHLSEPPKPAPAKLYDTAADPLQARDVLREHRSEAVRLHRGMLEFLRGKVAEPATLERLSAANVGLE